MPAYHSAFNQNTFQTLGTIPILPLKTKIRGVAPIQQDMAADDIIDEVLGLYKANTFFRNFDIKGGADRVLIYLILYLQECLTKLSKMPNQIEVKNNHVITNHFLHCSLLIPGGKILQTHAVQNFPLPGDANFPLNSMFEKPASRQDADFLKSYLTQLRQELSTRLIDRVYDGDKPSKWWMCFQKKKFMGMAGVGTMGM